jgi:hypothetical protein
MGKSPLLRALALLLSFHLAVLGILPHAALAGSIDTAGFMAMEQRGEQVDRIRALLSRDEVRDQLVAMGVDPAQAIDRVAALSDDELRRVSGRIESLPAGGNVLALVGAVFVVLLILELVGVTDVFSHL